MFFWDEVHGCAEEIIRKHLKKYVGCVFGMSISDDLQYRRTTNIYSAKQRMSDVAPNIKK